MLDGATFLPTGYSARAATMEDLAAVAALMAHVDRAEYGETALGEDFLRNEWENPRLTLATDTLILSDATGVFVAFAHAYDEDVPDVIEAMGMVHPTHRGRGLGAAVVAAQEERAAMQAARLAAGVRLRTATWAPDVAAKRLLESRGYRLVRSFFHMVIEVGDEDPPVPPPGIEARSFSPGQDERLVHSVLQAAFRGQWGYQEVPFEQWLAAEGSSGFDPGLSFVATEGEEVVGVLLGGVFEGDGWVSELGVLPAERGRGIGSFLLRLAFTRFHRHGHPRVLLNVDAENEAGAVGVYTGAGMHARRQWDLYEKEIAPAAGSGDG